VGGGSREVVRVVKKGGAQGSFFTLFNYPRRNSRKTTVKNCRTGPSSPRSQCQSEIREEMEKFYKRGEKVGGRGQVRERRRKNGMKSTARVKDGDIK